MKETKKKEDPNVAVIYQKERVYDFVCGNPDCGIKWFPDQPICTMCGSKSFLSIELPEKVTAYTPLQFILKFDSELQKMGFEIQFYSPSDLSADSIMGAKP